MHNRGWFKPGYDPRRHTLTREECSRGGIASWKRMMAEVRLSMDLPLPSAELRQLAGAILNIRRGVSAKNDA
jgi:CRISPR-associated Cas5-like protein